MTGVFGRMAESVLSLLGEDAFLRNASTPCKINIEHGVQITGVDGERAAARGDLVVERDVATVLKRMNPKGGDTFWFPQTGTGPHAGRAYRLETMIEDNGFSRRYTIIDIPWPATTP